MTEPLIELDTHNDMDSPATYDIPIINGGVVDTTKVIRFGGADSVDGAITAVTLPSSGDAYPDDCWLEDTDGVDEQLRTEGMTPDVVSGSQPYHLFKLHASNDAFAANPIITAYDDAGRTVADECLDGTTNHSSTFIKIVGATTSAQPAQYWGEGSSAALHLIEDVGEVVLGVGAQGLKGDDSWMACTANNLNDGSGTPQYFTPELSVPDDAVPGADVVNILLSVKYQYT